MVLVLSFQIPSHQSYDLSTVIDIPPINAKDEASTESCAMSKSNMDHSMSPPSRQTYSTQSGARQSAFPAGSPIHDMDPNHVIIAQSTPVASTSDRTDDSSFQHSVSNQFIKLDESEDVGASDDPMADLLQQTPDQDPNNPEPQMLVQNVHSLSTPQQQPQSNQVGTILICYPANRNRSLLYHVRIEKNSPFLRTWEYNYRT